MTPVKNRLAPKDQAQKNEMSAVFEANGMEVKLTPSIVRNYLVSGDKERVSMQEVAMFINLCKFSGLNPWLKEAYCIKYGNEPATMVVGKEAFMKRAENHAAYNGCKSGIIVFNPETAEIEYHTGGFYLPGTEIVGGWAEVWRKDKTNSTRIEISFDEYAGRKKDGSLNSQWGKKPATMIRKVALVQALREAFPNTFGGMYSAEEQDAVEPDYAPPEIIEAPETPEAPAPEIVEEPAPETNGAQATLFGK